MVWELRGQTFTMCSCEMLCACTLGPAVPDQGWCSAAFLFQIAHGTSDGVDLAGTVVAVGLDAPGDFISGDYTVRLYLDETASDEQRRELEAIFTGQKGGNWEAFSGLVTEWLPTQTTKIETGAGEHPAASVGHIGRFMLRPVLGRDGRHTQLVNAWVPAGALGFQSLDLAHSNGGAWNDPDLRQWEAGGWGYTTPFNWQT
jgi:hypothetical protein